MSTIEELRQQLADVSHERDLLRAEFLKAKGLLHEVLMRDCLPVLGRLWREVEALAHQSSAEVKS